MTKEERLVKVAELKKMWSQKVIKSEGGGSMESFEEGMIAAVNLGWDSDSIGAVYGQIAGKVKAAQGIAEAR